MRQKSDSSKHLIARRQRRVLLYGDVNLNVLDGSAVWLVSMAEVLSRTHSTVDVLLKTKVTNDRLLQRLAKIPSVRMIEPPQGPETEAVYALSPRFAAQRMLGLHLENDYDVIVARGLQICQFIAGSQKMAHRAWLYVTDLPFPQTTLSEKQKAALTTIATNSRRLFSQTEDARSYLESVIPESAGKCILLPPMIPDEFFTEPVDSDNGSGALRLVYAGKFAKDWRTLEMCDLPQLLAARGVPARLTMIGDKFQGDVKDKEWPQRMEEAIRSSSLDWVGGLPRDETFEVVSRHDLGLGWRTASLDSSLEISTKALEYAAAGVAPVVNRTAAHEALFGSDYPFLVEAGEIGDLVDLLGRARPHLGAARERARNAVEYYSMNSAAARLERAFTQAEGENLRIISGKPKTKVVLAGHDFKFAGELVDLLRNRYDIELRFDTWETLHKHDESKSLELTEWADIVICEWAGPNAVWYSQHKREHQRLLVRLHAFELRGPWLGNINADAIDVVICVSDLYSDLTAQKTGWPVEKIRTIANAVDLLDLDRPKKEGFKHRIGLVGMVPFLKRPDRALGVLEKVLEADERFTLHIRGRMPWEYAYEWNKPLQREAYLEFFSSIGSNSALKRRVVFEPFGADMGSWLRKIGFLLSPSTAESFHLAPAEGMASGAVPIFWSRPGVAEIFGSDFVVADSSEAADRILRLSKDTSLFSAALAKVRERVQHFDTAIISDQWLDAMGVDMHAESPSV